MTLPDTALWASRLAQYKPWLPHGQRGRWQPFWGPPPDSRQRNPSIPAELLRAWRAKYEEALDSLRARQTGLPHPSRPASEVA